MEDTCASCRCSTVTTGIVIARFIMARGVILTEVVAAKKGMKYSTPPLETSPLVAWLILEMDVLHCFKIIFSFKDILLFLTKSEMDHLK